MKYKIYISPPHMSGMEMHYIKKAFNQNYISSIGDNIHMFENLIENYLGNNLHVIALSSGTSAIHLALIACGVKEGDEVIVQSFSFVATVNPILYQGAIPVFIGSEKYTWNMSGKYLEKAIIDRLNKGKKIGAIIVVDTYGMPFQYKKIKKISEKYNIPLIEDAAEALGSSFNTNKCGTLGDYGIISFNGNKIITTSAGGAIICKKIEQKDHLLYLCTQAKKKGVNYYLHNDIGFNYRISNILAGIGCAQMNVIKDRVKSRRKNHNKYLKYLENKVHIFSEPNNNFFSNHWLNVIKVNDSNKLNILIKSLYKNSIETRRVWYPLHLQPIFKNYPYYGDKYCEELFNTCLCLPSGSNLTTIQIEKISHIIIDSLK